MDRVLEERHIRVGRIAGAGFGRLRGRGVRSPCTTEPREGRGASGFFAPAPPAEAPPEAPTRPGSMPGIKAAVFGVSDSVWSRAISSAAAACRRSSSARARAAASRVCRSASCRMRFWSDRPIPSSTACASGRATRVSASWGPVIAHEKRSPPTSTAINTTPAFVTMPPGSAPSGGRTHCFQRLI